MEMNVHLHKEVFDIVKDGIKDVEVRLYDEKRQKLKVGDKLIFISRGNYTDQITAVVKKIVHFKDFVEVTKNYEMKRIYLEDTSLDEYLELMNKFYSTEEQEKYGVVAIEFEKEN